ncbi:hypothetical protein FVO58_06660 [Metabacillus halosaccharovorans]|nr:hypothetical protein [Metabacillus halosaccharovorans]
MELVVDFFNEGNNFVVIKVLVENTGDVPLNSYPFALDLRLFSPVRLYDKELKEIEGRFINRFEDISDVNPVFDLVEVLPGGKKGYLAYS